MEYQANELLTLLHARELSRVEATALFEAYTMQIPARIAKLVRAVQTTAGYADWTANFSRDSLSSLGSWLSQQITTRPRTADEIEALYAQAPSWFRQVKTDDWELTETSFSLSMDSGMYFARALETTVPGMRWKMVTAPPNDINYQQPVLAGTGKQVFNPIHIVTTFAYGIARRSHGPERFSELFKIWINLLTLD